MIKLAVGLPFGGRYVAPEWACSLAVLQYPMNCNFAHVSVKGRPRGEARETIVNAAIGFGAEYLLFLDDDTAPPPNTPSLLIEQLDTHPDVAICGGIYTSRGSHPVEPMVFMDEGSGPFWRWRFGEVFPCWGLGTGCMMIRLSIFKDLPKPWFWDVTEKSDAQKEPGLLTSGPIEPVGFKMTDDIYFCRKVKQAGYGVLAHGGVLPIHWDQEGQPWVLPMDAFPLRKSTITDLWYKNIIPPTHWHEDCDDGLPSGWMSDLESQALAEVCRDKVVLELGAYKGRSTVCIAQVAKKVVSVDRHTGDTHTHSADTLPEYLRNIADYPNVVPVIADFKLLDQMFTPGYFDVVLVDGSHTLEDATRDFELAKRVGHTILAHDWDGFEVNAAAKAAGLRPTHLINTLAILEPVRN